MYFFSFSFLEISLFFSLIRNWIETNWITTRLRKYIEYVFLETTARNVIAFNYITSEDLRVCPRYSCVCVLQATMIVGQNKLCRVCKQVARNFRSYAYLLILNTNKTRNSKIETMKYPTNLLIFEYTGNEIGQNVGNIVR